MAAGCGPGRGDLRPGAGWRETELDGMRAYQKDSGPVQVSVSGVYLDRSAGGVRVHIWVYPRSIHTAMVETDRFELVEPGGNVLRNAAGAQTEMITRSRPEPFVALFEVTDLERILREGCSVRIPVVPLEPVEGPAVVTQVLFRPF